MPNETQKPIEKPWVVYGWFLGSMGVGKVVREEGNSVYIKYSEGQLYPSELWDSKWVKRFNNPVKAMAYFLVHQVPIYEPNYTKRRVIELFTQNFPSERGNLQKILFSNPKQANAQSQPKLTERVLEQKDESPFGPHPNRKDDDFVHPNKRY